MALVQSFRERPYENGKGTNPEELIAAAHAGCFTMALSAQLGNAGLVSEELETTATVIFVKLEAGCPISRLLNTTITMDAKLEE